MKWLNRLLGKTGATPVPRADAQRNPVLINPVNRTPPYDPDKTMPLYEACAEGDPTKVRTALAQEPNVNSTDWPSGFTPLHVCVSGSDNVERQAIVRLLHAAGAVLEAKDLQKGLTPLHYVALRDKPLCATALLECGADIHATEANGATALHGAAYHGHIEVAEVLLRHGADPALKDFRGNTPSDLAASRGHEALVHLLRRPPVPSVPRADAETNAAPLNPENGIPVNDPDEWMHLSDCRLTPNAKYNARATHNKSSPAYRLIHPMGTPFEIEYSVSFQTDSQGVAIEVQDSSFGTGALDPADVDVKSLQLISGP